MYDISRRSDRGTKALESPRAFEPEAALDIGVQAPPGAASANSSSSPTAAVETDGEEASARTTVAVITVALAFDVQRSPEPLRVI